MNVLYLCHRIPFPPDKGDKIRSYHLLTFLAKRGAVDLVTHVDDPKDLRHQQILRDICRSVDVTPLNGLVGKLRALTALPLGRPLSVAYMTRKATEERIHALLKKNDYDLVVAFSSQMAAYLPADLDVPVIMDMVDVDSEKWVALGERSGLSHLMPRIEGKRLRGLEKKIGDQCSRIVLTTPREVALYERVVGTGRVLAISNGVASPDVVRPQADRKEKLAIFLGTMDYEPNEEAVVFGAEEVWPLVLKDHPDAVFRIVGRNPTKRVLDLAQLPGVEVTGEVPDLREHLEAAAAGLVPLTVARGIQNKVLESMAWGLPVVCTQSVAACLFEDALKAVDVADTAETMAKALDALFRDAALREEKAKKSREYVLRHHDWSSIDLLWGDLLEEVVQEKRGMST